MNILAVETSAVTASAAVLCGDEIKAQISFTNGLTHSQTIMPIADYCLKGAGLTAADIDVFAASVGPGSFTGLRIGVGTVKGLAYACGKKCAGVSTMKALAYNIAPTDKLIVPIMDARRNQVYSGVYGYEGASLKELRPPKAQAIEDVINSLDREAIFVGDGVKVYKGIISEQMKEKAFFAPPQLCQQNAASVCYAAVNGPFVSPQELEVIYLRKPQAQREREQRLGIKTDE